MSSPVGNPAGQVYVIWFYGFEIIVLNESQHLLL